MLVICKGERRVDQIPLNNDGWGHKNIDHLLRIRLIDLDEELFDCLCFRHLVKIVRSIPSDKLWQNTQYGLRFSLNGLNQSLQRFVRRSIQESVLLLYMIDETTDEVMAEDAGEKC
jgi:hypothetical protein